MTLKTQITWPDDVVETCARAACWAFALDTDDCSSQCFAAGKCAAHRVGDSFKRDAIAVLNSSPLGKCLEALEPFAAKATLVEGAREAWNPSKGPLGDDYTVAIKLKHCRAARSLLTQIGKVQKDD